MQIVPLANDRSITDIAARVYALKPKDKRIAEASKALAAANPHLREDPRQLPAGTPIVVPALPGLDAVLADRIDPQHDALLAVLHQLHSSVQDASAAQLSGATNDTGSRKATVMSRTTSVVANQQTPPRAAALHLLHADLTAFLKTHE